MILLDTHVAIWLLLTPERLSLPAVEAIRRAELSATHPAVSVITFFEIANAIRRGRLQIMEPDLIFMKRLQSRFRSFPVSAAIAIRAAELGDPFPGDPMDRMIAATAAAENCTLLTADRRILTAGVCKTLW